MNSSCLTFRNDTNLPSLATSIKMEGFLLMAVWPVFAGLGFQWHLNVSASSKTGPLRHC